MRIGENKMGDVFFENCWQAVSPSRGLYPHRPRGAGKAETIFY